MAKRRHTPGQVNSSIKGLFRDFLTKPIPLPIWLWNIIVIVICIQVIIFLLQWGLVAILAVVFFLTGSSTIVY